jgi:hypothetical protein
LREHGQRLGEKRNLLSGFFALLNSVRRYLYLEILNAMLRLEILKSLDDDHQDLIRVRADATCDT